VRLSSKVAIVTGAGRGIGRGIAKVLAAEGAGVVVVDINEEDGRETVSEIESAGSQALFVKADMTKQVEVERMVQSTVDHFGKVDILCQNVGIYPAVPLGKMNEADWEKVLATNLKSGFFAVRACVPHMEKQRYGRIVMTSSITGPRTAIPGLAHYAASKAGINGFIKGAAIEFAKSNITVNGVEPGNVMTDELGTQLGNEYVEKAKQRIPMGRLATPEDIAYAVLFLASDEAKYITGQTIIVDGGQTIVET
jgi:3-oxoacyl-[acyl-carrier protein] reductase